MVDVCPEVCFLLHLNYGLQKAVRSSGPYFKNLGKPTHRYFSKKLMGFLVEIQEFIIYMYVLFPSLSNDNKRYSVLQVCVHACIVRCV